MITRVAILVVAICATASAARADAIDPPARARVLSDQGREYHAAGDYARAIESYKAAYELAPSPGLLFNMGQAYRLQGDCDDAAIMYRSYLRSNPDRAHRELTRSHLDVVEKCMTRRAQLRPLVGASDETALGASATGDDGPVDRPAAPGRFKKRLGLGATIGGGVLVGAGVYFAVDAADAAAEVERLYAEGAKWKDVKDIDARGRRSSKLATVFAISGGAAVIAGGVMYLIGRSEANEAKHHPSLSVAPTPGGGEVSVAWQF